jgi:DNA-binding transcriptional regulator YiaG
MTHGKRFVLKGHEMAPEPYQYRACGLDDIYLLSGFERTETSYGPGVTINDVPGLHRAIGLRLVMEAKPLSPREFRFLRKEMDLTQEALAQMLRVDAQTVARYEKDQTSIPGSTDKILRAMFLVHSMPIEDRQEILEEIKDVLEAKRAESQRSVRRGFKHDPNRGWDGHELPL